MRNYNAMVLAAGLGSRMRELTVSLPKPLLSVGGETLIDRTLNNLAAGGVKRVVVNLGYRADLLEMHLKRRAKIIKQPEIIFSDEQDLLLDTGGGVANAIDLFTSKYIFIVNSDVIRIDMKNHACKLLIKHWKPEQMDFLLLLHPLDTAIGFEGLGDFHINSNGSIYRRLKNEKAPFVYAGLCLGKIDQFYEHAGEIFSINKIWDESIRNGRLYGLIHQGNWFHVGSPEAIIVTENKLGR